MESSEFILYRTDNGQDEIQLRTEGETVWLTHMKITALFDTTKQSVSLHLRNIFKKGEPLEGSGVKESLTPAADGKRYQTNSTLFWPSVREAG